MRRMILGFAAAAVMALTASDASACHKKACTPACAPVAVCAPVKKCHFSMPKICMPKFNLPKLGCHKKAVCAPAPTCYSCGEVAYAAPQSTWPTSQSVAAPQMMPSVPAK